MDERAQREREQYNEGLKRKTYDKLLNPAKVYFLDARKAKASELFDAFPNPRVLEIGSETWFSWIERNGVKVDDLTCINISEAELENGVNLAKESTNKPNFMLMDAQNLEFEDDSFDIVFGSAILHHLDFERSLLEIKRVLKPDGIMFFAEPLDMNPVGRLVRWMTPKARTEDERPFRREEFRIINRHFDCNYVYEGLFSVPVGIILRLIGMPQRNFASRLAYRLDSALAKIPAIGLMCRHVFLVGKPL